MHFCRRRKVAKRDFKLEGFGKKKKGSQLLTRVGFSRVYKEVRPDRSYTAKQKAEILRDTILGHHFLRDSGLPVGAERGKVIIRGKERLVFDKARNLRPEELDCRMKEMIAIIKDANRVGVYFDAKVGNFGVDQRGRIVIRDTNAICAAKGRRALSGMLRDLEEGLNPLNAYHREALKKIKRVRSELNIRD